MHNDDQRLLKTTESWLSYHVKRKRGSKNKILCVYDLYIICVLLYIEIQKDS